MKQRITAEQIVELTNDQKERLRELWNPEDGDYFMRFRDSCEPKVEMIGGIEHADDGGADTYTATFDEWVKDYPLLSIGQMMQIVDTQLDHIRPDDEGWYIVLYGGFVKEKELADALWEATKKILEN